MLARCTKEPRGERGLEGFELNYHYNYNDSLFSNGNPGYIITNQSIENSQTTTGLNDTHKITPSTFNKFFTKVNKPKEVQC